ncbi:YfcE family phosphodiesterase [Lacticaseibacillus zhaodongensis]|uniref:YfcE family phosphodiesterase n=1 Tax=Lacticaseibacillus zhaodongensis TaxID=2668065 RepID=UPI0012D2FFE6|nr:metallophosphoesterase [Lacticaseibacillus zhaodongensis]
MRIIAVSDTHGDELVLKEIVTEYPDCAAYFYAGDSELAANDAVFKTYQAVVGNMDFDQSFPKTLTADVAGFRVFMTHGHFYNVRVTLDKLLAAGQSAGAQLIIYGHTHVALAEEHAGVVIVNPGSISQPRGPLAKLGGTFAIIDVDAEQIKVQYASRTGIRPELTRVFDR